MNSDKMRTVRTMHLFFVVLSIILVITTLVMFFSSPAADSASTAIRELVIILINIVTLIVSLVYVAGGYRKDAAIYYKSTICLLLLNLLFRTILVFVGRGEIIDAILHTIAIVMLIILFLNKDFGEKNTWFVFAVLLACLLLETFITIFNSADLYNLADRLALLSCAGTLGIMIKAKYLDKKARHSS